MKKEKKQNVLIQKEPVIKTMDTISNPVQSDMLETKKDSGMHEAFKEMSEGELEQKSHLKKWEITSLAKIMEYSNKYHFKSLTGTVNKFIRLRVSMDRKGRVELKEIAIAELQREIQKLSLQQQTQNIKQR